jgi:hypothetical protein
MDRPRLENEPLLVLKIENFILRSGLFSGLGLSMYVKKRN